MRRILFLLLQCCIIAWNHNNRTLSSCQACQFKKFFLYFFFFCFSLTHCHIHSPLMYMHKEKVTIIVIFFSLLLSLKKKKISSWMKAKGALEGENCCCCYDKSTPFQYCYVHHTLNSCFLFILHTYKYFWHMFQGLLYCCDELLLLLPS